MSEARDKFEFCCRRPSYCVNLFALVGVVYAGIAVFVIWHLLDSARPVNWVRPADTFPILAPLLPVIPYLGVVYANWKKRGQDLNRWIASAFVGGVARAGVTGFFAYDRLGLKGLVINLVDVFIIPPLVSAAKRRIKEINDRRTGRHSMNSMQISEPTV